MQHYMSVDVEDWYHVKNLEPAIPIKSWDSRESRVQNNILRILELFESVGTKATFFVLGEVARRYPDLVKAIAKPGHEIADAALEHTGLEGDARIALWTIVRNTIAERNMVNKKLGYAKSIVQTFEELNK